MRVIVLRLMDKEFNRLKKEKKKRGYLNWESFIYNRIMAGASQ